MYQRIPRCIVAAAALLASLSLSPAQTTVNFISGGTAAKKILIRANTATNTVTGSYKDWKNLEAARDDLAATLTQITGQTFTTGTFTGSSGGMAAGAIIIGKASDLNLSGSMPATNPQLNERFIIATANSGSNLVIAGVTNNGAVAGTYELLEQLGCRWYFLNSKWSKIPTDANLSWTSPATMVWPSTFSVNIGGVSQTLSVYQDEKPDYVARWMVPLLYGAHGGNSPHKEWLQQWDDFVAWSRRNRNVKGVNINDYHIYANIIKWAKEDAVSSDPTTDPPYSRWKPEFYAWISGSRVASGTAPALQQTKYYQLCAGNPEVLQLCKDYTDYYFSLPANDMQMSISMEPQDDTLFCDPDCPVCDANLPDGHNDTDKVLHIANAVAEHMETYWPNRYVGLLAYSSHADIPEFESAHESIYVSIATGYLYFGKTPEELLAQWYQVTPNLGIYDYLSNFLWDYGMPNRSEGSDLHYIDTAIPNWFGLHVGNYVAQTSMSDAILGLGHYTAAKKLWDTDVDVHALRDEFITDMFGSAAGSMDEFFKRIDKGNHYLLSEDLIGRLYGYLNQAFLDNTNGSNDPQVESRLDDLALWLRYCELRRAWESTGGSSRTVRTASASNAMVHAWKMRESNMIDTLSLGSFKQVWSDSYPNAPYEDALVWPSNTAGPYVIYSGTTGVYLHIQQDCYELNWDVPMVASSGSTKIPTLVYTTGTYPNIVTGSTGTNVWVQLYPYTHPWKVSGSAPYTHSEVLTIVTNGIAANTLLPTEPKSFGTDFVMSPFPALSGTHRGNHGGNPKGLTAYYLFTDSNGDTPPITLTAGTLKNLDKGDMDYTLYTADGITVISGPGTIENTGTVGPLVTETLVFEKSQFEELQPNTGYLLLCNDKGSYSSGTWTYDAKISVVASVEYPMTRSGATTHRYFYVPKGTTHVLAHAASFGGGYTTGTTFTGTVATGTYITGTVGTSIWWPSSTNFSGTVWASGTYIYSPNSKTVSIPVPAGTDDRIWDARTVSGNEIKLLNVPPLLAPTPQQLLIPKDAINYLVPSTGTSGTARGGASDFMVSATHTYQIYTSSTSLPDVTVACHNSFGDPKDKWKVYSGTTVIASGTVPAGSLGYSLLSSVTVTASNAYRLVYENNNNLGTELTWADGAKVCVEATTESPYSQEEGLGGVRYFFVPKGTRTITYAANSIPAEFSFYKAAGSVLKHTQEASTEPVNVVIQVDGDDDQFWKVGDEFSGIKFRFTNIPGHLGLRPDEVLVPRWTEID